MEFLYHPWARLGLIVMTLGFSIITFIGYTMVVAQVDVAKGGSDLASTKKVLNEQNTVLGQTFLLFGILGMITTILICIPDIVIFIRKGSPGSNSARYINHKEWEDRLSPEVRLEYNNWWAGVNKNSN